jgi:hypothetical protein
MFDWNSSIGYLTIFAFIIIGILVIYMMIYAIYVCKQIYILYRSLENSNDEISTALIDDDRYTDTSSDDNISTYTSNRQTLSIIIPPVSP